MLKNTSTNKLTGKNKITTQINAKKCILQTILIGTLCLFNATSYAVTPESELKSLLTNIKSMQANFSQKVYSETKKLLNTYAGNMEFKKPSSFRWEVTNPDQSLLVTNGVKLWNYDPDLEQVTIQQYNTNKEITPLSFVLDDPNNLSTNFNIEPLQKSCYKLTPKQENSNFVNIEVCFANKNIATVNILDHMGQNSKFEFSQVKHNVSIADKHFTFNPPAGVDVIGE